MNTIIMNQDVHTPAFIKADASKKNDKNRQQPTSPKQVRRFGWTRFIEPVLLLSLVIGAVYLISKMVTPQVVTAVSVISRFSDIALYRPCNPESDIYASELSVLAGDTLRHPDLCALKSTLRSEERRVGKEC